MKITLAQLEKLKAQGRIKDYSVTKKNGSTTVKMKTRNKTKEWIEKNLWYWAQANKLEMIKEHQFHADRKWRFDWYVPQIATAVEYEGVVSEQSRHTNIVGYTGDCEKYNEAAKMGFIVIRVTALNYKSLIQHLDNILKEKKNGK
jgi:very-short-patch-repair endonuclease